MLNKHYTSVLTLTILVTCGITSRSVASPDKVKSYSFGTERITTLQEDSSVNNENLTINSEQVYLYTNNSQETIIAQDVTPEAAGNENSTNENQSLKLWWLVPLIILVPLLGFLLLKPGSSSKTEQIDEEKTTSENRADTVGVSSPTSQNVTSQNITSEVTLDSSVSDRPIQEDAREDTRVEEIDNTKPEISTNIPLDDLQEKVEEIETQSESYEQEFKVEDNQSWSESVSPESSLQAEEIIDEIDESLATPRTKLASTNIESENLETNLTEELTVIDTIAQSSPDVLAKTDEINTEAELEQTEQITDQDLANISEWLNEKIDSDNKDISVMDDFWDNLSSITEEISGETTSEQKEQISDRELANISEWLNEKVEPDYNLSDATNNSVDDLFRLSEDKEQDSNEELLNNINNNLNLEEEQNHNTRAKKGISDSTSNFLEELLNDDSNQESKH